MAMSNAERQRRFRERLRKAAPQNRTFPTRLLQAFSNEADRLTAKSIRTGTDELRGAAPATHQVNTALPGEMFRRMAAVAEIFDLKVPEVIRVSALIGLPKALLYFARCHDLIGKQEALEQKFISEVRETNRAVDFAIKHAADSWQG